ncbi:MAG: N-acetylneuraminate synthase family protein [Deltaproteobacteria bacterium]|nr:N-acetylneuraminate synthase family protein [Deltaproteobacteria bacterium]
MRIIAEIGSVHDGSFGNALHLIDAAASAGADTVKFQTHIAEAETLTDAPSPSYFKAEKRVDYFKRTGFSLDQWKSLSERARENKVTFLSSPFSIEAVELLEKLNMAAYKIPSGEVSNLPLLEKIAATKKPVLLSSGMSAWNELDRAVSVLKKGGPLTILQCSSVYPCPPEKVGLNVLEEMKNRYQIPVGFSDHTLGIAAPLAAASLGATVIEKHFTFSRSMYGSDAKHSMEPQEFLQMSTALKEIWRMLENPVDKSNVESYIEMKKIFEKSIVTASQLSAGTVLENHHLAFKKPGDGINAADYSKVIGKKIKRDLPSDYKLREEDLTL